MPHVYIAVFGSLFRASQSYDTQLPPRGVELTKSQQEPNGPQEHCAASTYVAVASLAMMTATLMNEVEKPTSPKRAAAELEAVLSKSLFLTTPEGSDFDGSISLNESDISRDSALDWAHPERFRLPPRSASMPRPRQVLERSRSEKGGWQTQRPTLGMRSKSASSITASEFKQMDEKIRHKSLIDDDSATAASSAKESSTGNSEECFTFIANIGDMKKDSSHDTARSVGSRKSRRSKQSRISKQSRRSMRSRKRGDSLERDISLTILQTAEQGADEAHFLVSAEEDVKILVKSAEEILGDLFVSQDTSLEPISLEDGATEFQAFFPEQGQLAPSSEPLTSKDEQPFRTNEFTRMTSPTALQIDPNSSSDSDSIFTFHPDDDVGDENEQQYHSPRYAENYLANLQETNKASTIVSEAPSADSLFTFSESSEITTNTSRGNELLFPEDALKEEFPIGTRWSPDETPNNREQPVKSPRLLLSPRPEYNDISFDRPSTSLDAVRKNSSPDPLTDRYETEMECNAGINVSRSSDGACEVQHAMATVTSPAASESNFAGALNLEREDSFVDDSSQEQKVAQEEIFLDKLVDIVQVARERPRDIALSQFYKSESCETESSGTVEYPQDTVDHPEDEQFPSAKTENKTLARVDSLEKLAKDAHPDPELDDFLDMHGFGDSDSSDSDSEDEVTGENEDDWMAFDSSPFGVSRFSSDEGSGLSAPPPESGKHSPESPTSITDFSSNSSAREKAKVIWWNKEQTEDDMLSI